MWVINLRSKYWITALLPITLYSWVNSGYSGCVFPLPSVFISFLVQQKTRIHKPTKQL